MTPIYKDEDKIVWLKDHDALARMNYVRERWLLSPLRTGQVKAAPEKPTGMVCRLMQLIRSW